jgi:hypothetical protein
MNPVATLSRSGRDHSSTANDPAIKTINATTSAST